MSGGLEELLRIADDVQEDFRYTGGEGYAIRIRDCATALSGRRSDETLTWPQEGSLTWELVLALMQYKNDLLHPPAEDSKRRRLEMIDRLLERANVK